MRASQRGSSIFWAFLRHCDIGDEDRKVAGNILNGCTLRYRMSGIGEARRDQARIDYPGTMLRG